MRAQPRQRKPNTATAPPSSSPHNHCRAIIRVDSSALRDKARRDYDKARADLAKAQTQADRFEKEDRPEFLRWFHTQFGRLLTEIRELQEKILKAEEITEDVEAEVYWTGCSYQRAYQRVQRRQREADQPPPEDRPGAAPDSQDAQEEEESERDFFDELFGQFFSNRSRTRKPKPARTSLRGRVKDLYRALVRLLHPDKNKKLTGQELEWWHQTQAAYQTGDEAQLELILTLCELERKDHDVSHTTLSVLARITQRLKSSLREIRRKLRQYQADPAWQFTSKKNHELLHHQLQRQLEEEIVQMREEYKSLERMMKTFKSKTKQRRRAQPEWWL